MKSVATDPQRKARALRRAADVGAAQASRETGVPAGTIRAWRARDAESRAVALATEGKGDVAQTKRIIAKTRNAAERGVDRLNEILPTAKNPQSVAVAVGVAIDKVHMLTEMERSLEEHEHRIAEKDAETIVLVLRECMQALGLPWETGRSPLSTLFGDIMRRIGDDVIAVDPAKAEAARADVMQVMRAKLEPQIRAEVEAEVRARVEAELREAAVSSPPQLALPPAGGTSRLPVGSLAGPRKAWESTPVPRREPPVREGRGRVVPGRPMRSRGPRYGDSEFS